MMLHDALLSYLHFAAAFIVAGALVAEFYMLRLPLTADTVRVLLRADMVYGIAAGSVILAGLARVFWGAKDESYYWEQPFFWAKIAAFVVVGVLSVLPTRAFFKWKRALASGPIIDDVRGVRRLVLIELHVFALIPLFAALMARGVGAG